MEVILLLATFAIFLFLSFFILQHNQTKRFFESKGIPYLGNGSLNQIIQLIKGIDLITAAQNQYSQLKSTHHKISLTNHFGKLSFIVGNLSLLKLILVKDFSHFEDRRRFPLPKRDVIFNKLLFSCSNEDGRWKSLRNQLTPIFTTGKIRKLFPVFEECGKKFANYLDHLLLGIGEIDFCEAYSKFAMDLIASAVCATNSAAFDQVEPSLFEKMGQKMQIKFGFTNIIKLIMLMTAPKLAEILKLSYFKSDAQEFFTERMKTCIQDFYENNNNVDRKRNDFIKIMLEEREKARTKKQCSETIDDDTIVANCFLFILAGFDTTQSILLFCAYALALNQDVQDRLREEVEQILEENGGKLSFDCLARMTYLDMVINESLRMYPTSAFIDRECTLDYKVPGIDLVIRKGQGVLIPVYGIHHDEEYYPEPEKFSPERFSAVNKSAVDPYTCLGFGKGRRDCIGKRFAMTEVKVAISTLVHNFKITPSSRTMIPMKFESSTMLRPEGRRMWLALRKIEHFGGCPVRNKT